MKQGEGRRGKGKTRAPAGLPFLIPDSCPLIPDRPFSLLRLLRPHQWLKNGFVFVGLIFGHAWRTHWADALIAFIAFCLLASAVYVFNDFFDRAHDRLHPDKQHRPLASGAVSPAAALVLALLCLGGGLTLAFSHSRAPWLFAAYLAANALYSLGAKHIVVLDVLIIASGFMLRILVGTLGVGIPPTHWLLLCGLMLTLFLGFGKRRAELGALNQSGADPAHHRRVLADYTPRLLDRLMRAAAAGAALAYAGYTVSPATAALHGTPWLPLTIAPVLYGLIHYTQRLRHGGGGDPARELLKDARLRAAVVVWLLMVIYLLL